MRIQTVLHYLGLVLVGLGGLMALPLAWSLSCRGPDSYSFLVSALATSGMGVLLWKLARQGEGSLSRREGLALVAGAWLVGSALGALPYVLAGTFDSYIDAYFEAMSGFTTTGATVLTSIETQPQGILLWRNFTQWVGGMGIVTLFVALGPVLGLGAARLFEAEMPGPQHERLKASIRYTTRVLWLLYCSFSVLEFLLLWLGGRVPVFDCLLITFGTMPTGGFLHRGMSIGAYESSLFVTSTVTCFMVIAGVNFALYYFLFGRREPGRVIGNPELRAYISVFVVASLLIAFDLVNSAGQAIGDAFRHATFQAASIQTTTGFTTANFDAWPSLSRSLLLVLMIIGASAGSTGGALKVVRVLVVAKHAFRQVVLAFSPRSVIPLRLGGSTVPESTVSAILGTCTLYFGILVIGFLVMSGVGLDHVTAFSSVAATLGNVGPGLGLVGPTADYSSIPALGKVTLVLCMLLGRLELLTVMALVSPAFWKWR